MDRQKGYSLDKISKNLYLGDYFASVNLKLLTSLGITHILVCGYELTCRFPQRFKYLKLSIDDTPTQSISQYFSESYSFISEGIDSGSVLIHCAQGRSRSVSITISYLMRKKGLNFSRAFEKVRKKHPESDPNPGFKSQLEDFQQIMNI